MASKKAKEEEVVLENSTVVLNDDATETPVANTADTTQTEDTDKKDECKHDENCTCEWGKCPKETCERYYENPENVPTSQEFIYHLDADGNKTEIKKANPNYKKEETTDPAPVDPKPEPKPEPNPDEPSKDPETPSNDCGDEIDEPWAHDTVGDLREEIRTHSGIAYNVIDNLLEELSTATDDDRDAIINHIAWHIPTGGPKSIKAHHKAKIVAALKAYKG